MRSRAALVLAALVLVAPACKRHRSVVRGRAPVVVSTQTIAAANHRTCLLHDGQVKCVGQLGPRVALAATSIPGTEGALAVDDAGTFGCVIKADHTVACFGADTSGELGGGNQEVKLVARAVAVPGVRDAVQLALGRAHACARLADGRVACWGGNAQGQLGRADATTRAPGLVRGLDAVVDLIADLETTCAIRRDGSAWCFGAPFGGKLARLGLAARARHLALAHDGGCVAHVDGSAGCFSFSDAPGLPRGTATPMPTITRARAIALSERSRCVLDDTRAVACWTPFDGTLHRVEGLSDVTELVAAHDHVCARTAAGEAFCWGDDSFGQLGDRAPVVSEALATPRRIEVPRPGSLVMGGAKACTVGQDVWCWSALPPVAPPRAIENLAGTRLLARGRDHSCAIDAGGALRCFGLARAGQLGRVPEDGGWTVPEPTLVPGLPPIVDVAIGDANTCARAADGRFWCFGSNASGEFAIGSASLSMPAPTPIPALKGARRVALGAHHLCALLIDGTVSCAGSNGTGELGDGRGGVGSSPIPVMVSGLDQVVELRLLDNHSCARRDGGEVRCWGTRFRASDASHEGKGKGWFDTPQPIAGTGKTLSLAVGRRHACVVREGGDVLCWGSNEDGACGAPIDGELATPRVVTGVEGALEVRAAERTTCARTAKDEIWCWGADRADVGSDGQGFAGLYRESPVRVRP